MLLICVIALCLPYIDGAVMGPTPRLVYDVPLDFEPAFCSILENKEKTASTGKPAYDLGLSSFTGNM